MHKPATNRAKPFAVMLTIASLIACGVVFPPVEAAPVEESIEDGSEASQVDVEELIQDAMFQHRPDFKMGRRESRAAMLELTGAIDKNRLHVDPELVVSAYYDPGGARVYDDVAELAMNDYPVAAGALFLMGTTEQQRAEPAWKALGRIVAGVFRDGVQRVAKGSQADTALVHRVMTMSAKDLGALHAPTQSFARLKVLGALWADPIAEQAGAMGLALTDTSAEDAALIRGVLARGATMLSNGLASESADRSTWQSIQAGRRNQLADTPG